MEDLPTRRKRMMTSTPAATGTFSTFAETEQSPIKTEQDSAEKNGKPKKYKIEEKLITDAVQAMGVKGKGASYQSITKYIRARDDGPDMDSQRTKVNLKKAIMNCIERGVLKRPKRNETANGATGHFILVDKKPKRKSIENEKPPKDTNSKPSKADKPQKEKNVASKVAPVKQKKPPKVEDKKPSKEVKKDNLKEKQPKKPKPEKATKKVKAPEVNGDEIALSLDFSDSGSEEKAPIKANAKKTKQLKSKNIVEENFEFQEFGNEKSSAKATKQEKPNSKKQNPKEKVATAKPNKAKKHIEKEIKEEIKEDVINEVAMPETENIAKELDPEVSEPAKKMPKVVQSKKGAVKAGKKMNRKDLSDTELNLTHHKPMPLKSYSSDTELEVSKRIEAKNEAKGNSNLKPRNNSRLKKDNSSVSQNQTKSRKKM